MIIEKRTDDEDVTVVVQFEDKIALLGHFEIKTGAWSTSKGGLDLEGDNIEFIGLLGNLDEGTPINVLISKEIFEHMKVVYERRN